MFSEHRQEIAVVISDLGLPRLEGQGFCKRIRAIDPTARVIIASGYMDPVIKERKQKYCPFL